MRRLFPILVSASFLFLGVSAQAGSNLAQLLTSSPWCSFTYNKTTGYSHTKRYVFRGNGTYSMGSRGEGYSSGGGGTFASQRDSGGGGQWKVNGDQFFLSEGGEMEQVDYRIKTNSNGAPIIVADGVEYSQCN